ncbi:shikimate kinase (plasmid) [Salmonella enterica subsp. enterica serovar Karamoja]|uniref:Shikimate kinase n=1 Tax=Salmonella enterica subsp. enterica serovar Karamoja TaxID=2500153 RepID=A0A3Q9MQB0_SALET|nr:shikimate kinase [Salmonella enterica subsp. enterica serovar Karamoja]
MSRLSGYPFIDLDDEFCRRILNIRVYIARFGYAAYLQQNAALARTLLPPRGQKAILALSSGFLSTDTCPDIVAANCVWVAEHGHTVLLLPDRALPTAEAVVVARQLGRGFGLKRDTEIEKFRIRFREYLPLGETQIFSRARPSVIAMEIWERLNHQE